MNDLINLLKRSEYVVAFTGAGVSTLSGIPDFRGPDGIYKRVDADRIFDVNYFVQDPSYYYSHAKEFIYELHLREPSIVHTECARLEEAGIVGAVITQNIDMLHRRAGSKNVIEVHGSPTVHRCLQCGREYSYDWASECVHRDEVPTCEACGGLVKPDITFFGELLPEGAIQRATEEASRADLMLVLGTSLFVQPAASLPLYTLESGGAIAIVNQGATPLDMRAACRYDDLESCFRRIAQEV